MRTLLIITYILLNVHYASAQNEVYLFVLPSNSIIEIDGKKVKNKTRILLDTGFHVLKAWNPNYQELNDSIYISNATRTIKKSLLFNTEYKSYLQKDLNYRINKTFQLGFWSVATIVSATSSFIHYDQLKIAQSNTDFALQNSNQAYQNYLNASTSREATLNKEIYRETYRVYKETIPEVNRQKRNTIFLSTSFLISSTTLFFSIRKFVRKKKPTPPLIVKPLWIN